MLTTIIYFIFTFIILLIFLSLAAYFYSRYYHEMIKALHYIERKFPKEYKELSIGVYSYRNTQPLLFHRIMKGGELPRNKYLEERYARIKRYYSIALDLLVFITILFFLWISYLTYANAF